MKKQVYLCAAHLLILFLVSFRHNETDYGLWVVMKNMLIIDASEAVWRALGVPINVWGWMDISWSDDA